MATTNIQTFSGDVDVTSNILMSGEVFIKTNDGNGKVGIGLNAGLTNQGANAVAVGNSAGATSQGASAVAVGERAGVTSQGNNTVAVGYEAGKTDQGSSAVAVGNQAGETSQGNNAVAIGKRAGRNSQGGAAIALGPDAGQTAQGGSAVAIGEQAALTSQGTSAVAIGDQTARYNQGANAVAVGNDAGLTSQGEAAVAVGGAAGQTAQGGSAVAIGEQAALTSQGASAVAIGDQTARYNQGANAVAVGTDAGLTSQGEQAVAVGRGAGLTSQGLRAVAVGHAAGETSQGNQAVAMGYSTGRYNQGVNAVAVGVTAGQTSQGGSATAVGVGAGGTAQGGNAVAMGNAAGGTSQGTSAVAVGALAGQTSQGDSATAVGRDAGRYNQGVSAVAVGEQAGRTSQGDYAVGVGYGAGQSYQGDNAVAVGNKAGLTSQGDSAVAVGRVAGETSQGDYAVAVGNAAGRHNQSTNAVAVGRTAGATSQGASAVAVGQDAARYNQGTSAVAVGNQAGQTSQGASAVAVGVAAGNTSQGDNAVAVGNTAGQTSQGNQATAVGTETGRSNQGLQSTAVGHAAGNASQGASATAVGSLSGFTAQGGNATAVGRQAGQTSQGASAVAVGIQAGQDYQGDYAVAVGQAAGYQSQGNYATAVGINAGQTAQGLSATAVGVNAGLTSQGVRGVAVGDGAGTTAQGDYAVAVGYLAGQISQHDNSIVLNASGAVLNTAQASSFYVKPVRGGNIAASALAYTSAGEVVEETNIHFDTNGAIGIGEASPSSKLTVNEIPVHRHTYDHSLAPMTITNRTPTSNSALNDPKDVLNLAREGTEAEAFGARATFKLSRWENSDVNSRTRLDLNLAHDYYNEPHIMTFRSDGNVGIGTQNPDKGNLSIYGLGADPYFTGFSEGDYADATDFTGLAHFHSSGSHGVIRISNSADKTGTTRIDFNTRLGAYWGTNTPSNSYFRGTAPTAGRIMVSGEIDDNYEDSYMTFHTCRDLRVDGQGGTGNLYERMRITSEGDVGIGTTEPSAKLDVFSSSTDPGAVPTLHVGDGAIDYGDYGMLQLTRSPSAGGSKAHAAFIRSGNSVFGMGFHNNTNTFGFWPSFSTVTNTPTMSFTSGGNVGIGTASPDDVFETYDSVGRIKITRSANTNIFGCALDFALLNSANAKKTYARIGGSIADNTSGSEDGFLSFQIITNGALGDSYQQDKMRITSDGNVGIGVTNPVAALDFGSSVRNRIINLWGSDTGGDSSTSYYGFGVNSGTLRYNVDVPTSTHKFYGGSTEFGYVNNATGFVNSFTGQHKSFPHESLFGKTSDDLCGLIVSASGEYISINDKVPQKGQGAIQVSEAIPTVKLSTSEKDKKVFGVISDVEDVETSQRHDHYGAFVSTFEKEQGDSRIYVNSIGEGAMWVVNTAGPLESGDYITTSNVAGYGQRQESDSLKNYTVAKITMDCDFVPATQPIQIIKKELSNVNYWVKTTYSNVSLEEYSNLAEENRTTEDETYYTKDVERKYTYKPTVTVTVDDAWDDVSIFPSDVTYAEWSNLEANVQNTYTLTYTQNDYESMRYEKTTVSNVTAEDAWDAVHIEPPGVTYAEYSNLESNVQNTYTLTYTKSVTMATTPAYYSNLAPEEQNTYSLVYTKTVTENVEAGTEGADAHVRTIYKKIEREDTKEERDDEEWVLDVRQELVNVLDEHGQLQWEDDPSGATEKAYKIRYLDVSGQITDEANAVHTAAFVGVTYHCG
jgi:hypothetical protein